MKTETKLAYDYGTHTKWHDPERDIQQGGTIDIIVEGGVIQDIIGIPKGITIRTIDYDVDGADPERLSRSPYDDNECFIGEWK